VASVTTEAAQKARRNGFIGKLLEVRTENTMRVTMQ